MFDKFVMLYNHQNKYTAEQRKTEYKNVDDEMDEDKSRITN
ncbi:hypothetical protein [Paenibacillus alba]|uniref:Uncharacterized protein n=2 Tax=Paenibacillus alba TaxID=1197127 RepID=A0ABU6FW42_9BACL|nr:hypothetical protein [Paenibacillus alba]MEC0225960.1 hypothetical protein [Paenibacillus alba]